MFNTITTEEQAYWLGFLIADGSISRNYIKLALAKKDRNHLQKFKDFLGSSNKISDYSDHSEFVIGSKKLCKELEQFGVVPRKSFTCFLPTIDNNLQNHLIRGIWDGDGSVLYRARSKKYPDNFRPEVQLCGNKQILESVQSVFKKELNITPSKLSPVKSIYLFRKNTSPAKKIIKYLYEDSSIYLDRKYEKALLGLQWEPRRQRKEVCYFI